MTFLGIWVFPVPGDCSAWHISTQGGCRMFCSVLPGTCLPTLLDCRENWRAALARDSEAKHESTPAGVRGLVFKDHLISAFALFPSVKCKGTLSQWTREMSENSEPGWSIRCSSLMDCTAGPCFAVCRVGTHVPWGFLRIH